ncbi:hypothetical protein CYY_001578 [Polysphondylium violaceum]|uniref:IPT/TIG domain-containing protein n=1 Tax=Polysphondylium violaceum TaxID=133409 RepID=A0A8J4UW34_9MYCE|nr:hypothetical protein CYY_001578 [Polysphondylium violaceum]
MAPIGLLLILSVFYFYPVLSLPDQQITVLSNIATDCGFTWTPGVQCGATSSDALSKTKVVCAFNATISDFTVTELSIESTNKCSLRNEFNSLPDLKTLNMYSLNMMNVPQTIYTHTSIETIFYSSSLSTDLVYSMTTGDGTNDYTRMTSLKVFHIESASGVVPKLPNTITEFYCYSTGVPALQVVPSLPMDVFSVNLRIFLAVFHTKISSPSSLLDINIFDLAPNMVSFTIYSPSYPVKFSNFFNPPASLTTLSLYLLDVDDKNIPSVDQVNWGNLVVLLLYQLQLKGTVDPRLFQLKSLTYVELSENPALQGSIPTSIGEPASQIYNLNIRNTAFSGQIPSNFLDSKILMLDFRGTQLSGALPTSFMCFPNSVFETNAVNPKFLFDDNKFSNYQGPSSYRNCTPQITSVVPDFLTSGDTTFAIHGVSLGTTSTLTRVSLTNNVGTSVGLTCVINKLSSLITCYNPNIQGYGQLSVQVLNEANPLPITSIGYGYRKPEIYYISTVPTLGGRLTVYGVNLFMRDKVSSGNKITIGSQECQDLRVEIPFGSASCLVPQGIQSLGDVNIYVEGQSNGADNTIKFNYRGPTVNSPILIGPNIATDITLTGKDFWNDTSLVTVTIDEDIDCSVKSVNHNTIVCTVPPTPFSAGSKNIQINVNGQISPTNSLFQLADPQYCPNACGTDGFCDLTVGFCICKTKFGPACDLDSAPITVDVADTPMVKLANNINPESIMTTQLLSVVENSVETSINGWTPNKISDLLTSYSWTGPSGQSVVVYIRKNTNIGMDKIGYENITYPANSFTYSVKYNKSPSSESLKSLQFKFSSSATPDECQPPPQSFAYATGQSTDLHWSLMTKYGVQYHTRFPLVALVNNNADLRGNVQVNPITQTGNLSTLLINVNSYSTNSVEFQYDMAVYGTSVPRLPILDGCILNNNNNNVNPSSTNSNNWKIGVGIGVGIGGACLIGAVAFIFRQKLKMKKTQSLLDKKLAEMNNKL